MLRMLKSLFKIVGLLVLAVIAVSAFLLWRGGALRTIEPHFDGACTTLALDGSAEDVQVDPDRGFAYLSLIDRRKIVRGEPAQGTIARVDLNVRPLTVENAIVEPLEHFRPHGMSLFTDDNGQRYLFVINHPVNRGQDPEHIELFREISPGRFAHVETFASELIHAPNDLVAVGPRQVYVANDAVAGDDWLAGMKKAAQQFGFGYSTLVWLDGSLAEVVADDIASGGGINASADGLTLYVAETLGQRIRVLARNPNSGDVADLGSIDVGTSPDNIDVAADGSLWIGAHANTLKLIQHFVSGSPAPSQVVRVRLAEDVPRSEADEVFLDDGQRISASSVGATYRDKLLIGSITDRKLLVCEMAD